MLGLNTGGLNGNETEAAVQAFIAQTLCTFPVAWDDTPNTMDAFAFPPAISPFPRQVVIDRAGGVAYLNSEYDESALRAAIEAAL